MNQYYDTNEMGEEMSETPRSVDFTEIATGNVSLPNDKEFAKLDKYVEKDGSKSKMSEGRKNNQIGLNRNTDMLPFDEHRVKLREPINGRDYVNANWLSKMANNDYYDGTADTTKKGKFGAVKTAKKKHSKGRKSRKTRRCRHKSGKKKGKFKKC